MTTDNTTPRIVSTLTAARDTLDRVLPRLPTVVRRLDNEQPGWPTGHTASGSPTDGPDRWQTSDPALHALQTLLKGVERLSKQTAELDHLTANWSNRNPSTTIPDTSSTMWCVSCLRAGSMNPRRSTGGDLCRWCLDTLRAVNHHRRTLSLGPLVELPLAAVQRHARGERTRDVDIDLWARTETKGTKR